MYKKRSPIEKRKNHLFRLSAIAAAIMVALPCVSEAATISSVDPNTYEFVVKNGTESFDDQTIGANGAKVSFDNGASQKHGVLARTAASGDRATINLGNENTQSVNITVDGDSSSDEFTAGITAVNDNPSLSGGLVAVKAKNVNIDVQGEGNVRGIFVQNRTTNSFGELAIVTIDADNTVINARSTGGTASGIVAMSQGIVEIKGNLEVNADNAIVARGNAKVHINEDGDKTVKLNGDIDFDYDGPTSGTEVDADVLVNLAGADSYWNGNAKISWDSSGNPGGNLLEVSGMSLGLSDGAQWNPTAIGTYGSDTAEGGQEIAIDNLTLNDGIINIKTAGQQVNVKTLSGTGGTINVAAQANGDGTLQAGSLQVVGPASGHLAVNYRGIDADDLGSDPFRAMNTLAANIQAEGTTQTQTVAEGDIAGTVIAQIDENGGVTAVTESRNSVMNSLQQIAQNNFLVFRSQMNDMDKRMGDLRTMPQTSGMWARAIAGQSEYKDMHNTYQTLQIGADRRIGNFLIGATASYTDGDGKIDNGSTEDKNYSFGIYGSWLGDDGQFVDVTLKRHHTQSDYDLYYTRGEKVDGSMHTSGTSLSVEYGKRFNIADTNYYFEPQAELMYGHLNSVDYTTSNGVRIDQDAIKSLVGRLGIAAGWVSPEKTGSVYIKASILNDWEGESDIRASKNGIGRKYSEDMGGTWGEFALGGSWNINKSLAAYGEVETTAGNPVRTTYQVSGGIRYSF